MEVEIHYGYQIAKLPLVVVSGEDPSLLGCDWMMKIKLNWIEIYAYTSDTSLAILLDHHSSLYEPELGKPKSYKASMQVDPQVKPKFYKACPVPYAMKEKMEAEL